MNTTHRTSRYFLSIAAVAALTLGATACGSDDDSSSDDATEDVVATGEVTIDDAWSREPADGQTATAVYGLVTNGTDDTITAVSASTSVTDHVELHEVIMDDEGQMSMQEKEGGYEISAGGSVLFEPGGAHIMLLDIDPATYPDTVDITLTFDNGTSIEFEAEVRALDGSEGMDMDHDSDADEDGEGDHDH